MASISFDRQSFSIDGRRIWLVSGAIHYPRVPREQWRERIRAARQAGLNTIETYVFWNRHEPRPGVFDWQGDADLRHFVQLIGEEGMYCILRPGPYVCAEWDLGGLPAWLLPIPGMKLRESAGPFLEASARYIGEVMKQVADLQITSPSEGPIIMMQAENEWLCHNPPQADAYLRELVRYLRENGCAVPINECNNLWQPVDGAFSTWNANTHLAEHLRQLHAVHPTHPRIVTEYWPGWFDRWGGEHHTDATPRLNLHRLAQILAVGAQYSIYMFHGGTNFGFWGGRSIASPDCFMTTSYDYDAPLKEAGGRGAKYAAVKRISTFASQFSHVLANLEADYHPVTSLPVEQGAGVSVMHQAGPQGELIFILQGEADKTREIDLLLSNGLTLKAPLSPTGVTWLGVDVNLGGIARLTQSNLQPWAFVRNRMLVMFGPEGADGEISIDDAPLRVTVPQGREPLVEMFEDLTVVVLNEEQIDAAYLFEGGLAVGCCGLDEADQPIPASGWTMTTVNFDGATSSAKPSGQRKSPAPKLAGWEQLELTSLVAGTDPAFEPIDGPQSLEALGVDRGYGWYRFEVKAGQYEQAMAVEAADRVHLFVEGKRGPLLGVGPGAVDEPTTVEVGRPTVALVDNLGRFNFGWRVGERKGMSEIYSLKPVRLTKPSIERRRAPDLFELGGFFNQARRDVRPVSPWVTWKVKPAGRKPLVVDFAGVPGPAVLIVNGEPHTAWHPTFCAGRLRIVLHQGEAITGGQNELTLAYLGPLPEGVDPAKGLAVHNVADVATQKADWSFARWAPPAEDAAFVPVKASAAAGGAPCWYRARFNAPRSETPVWFEPVGMSKGQIFVNGRNAGRYFVATAQGDPVPPQERYLLPTPWLNANQPNELLIFDEHGRHPGKCRLTLDEMGPYGD